MADISNGTSYIVISGTADADSIRNFGYSVTINAGAGNDNIYNDTIYNYSNGGNVYKLSGGNDTIYGYRENDTIYVGSASYTTAKSGNDFVITSGSDSLVLRYCANLKITVKNSSGEVQSYNSSGSRVMSGSSLNDTILNANSSVTIDAGDGNDSIRNHGYMVTIDAGTGNDYVYSTGSYATIKAGAGNDTIWNQSSSVTIDAGDDNDYISNDLYSSSVTIDAGAGNDSIRNSGSRVSIDAGAGNDSVYNGGGSRVTISAGAGNDSIENWRGSTVTIDAGDGDDSIRNSGDSVTISAGAGNDAISNDGDSVSIDAGDGNDTIWNWYGSSVTIDAGAGNDNIISNSGRSVTINAGAGADIVSLSSYKYSGNNTVSGGIGDDTIYLNSATTLGNVYVYQSGDGSDTIYNATKYDTISIGGASYTRSTVGDDLILNVTDGGAMTLVGAANIAVNIKGTLTSEIPEPAPEPGDTDTSIDASVFASLDTDTSVQLLKDLNKLGEDIPVEENGNYSNEIVKELMSSSNGIIRFITTVFEESTRNDPSSEIANIGFAAINDMNSVLNSIFNIANGEVTGADLVTEIGSIGNDVADLAEQIYDLVKTDSDTELIPPIASYIVGLATNVVAVVADGASKDEVAGIIENATNLLAETINLLSESPTLKTWFENKTAGKILTGVAGKAGLIVTLGLGLYAGFEQYIESTEKYQLDGVLASTATKDKWVDTIGTTLHSLTNSVTGGLDDFVFEQVHGAVAVSVANISYGLQYLAALVSGGDTSNIEYKVNTTGGKNYIEILGDAFKAIFFQQITGTTNGDKIVNSTEKIIMSGAGDDDIYNYNSNVEIYAGDGVDTVFCNEDSYGNYIDGGEGNDKITFYGTSNIVHGSAGNDMIVAFSNYKTPTSGNQIFGESGNDYIVISDVIAARKSHNTVSGGADKDIIVIGSTENPVVIQYATGDGDDVVYGYSSNDTIQITKGDYVTAASGQDIIITVGTGKITLVGAQGQKLNILKEAVKVEGITEKNGTLTLSKTFRGKTLDLADYAASVTKVNASALTAEYPVNVTGNSAGNSMKGGKGDDTIFGESGDDILYGGAGNDSIFGGLDNDKLYGEAGNDTLYGGTGNDTMTGGAGSDVFVCESGSDTITDYAAGTDKIKLSSASITGAYVSGKNVILQTSNGTITVKNGKGKAITVIDKNGAETTNVYPLDTMPAGLSYDSSKKVLTVDTSYGGAAIDLKNYASTTKTVDASTFKKKISITGNDLGNTITGGSGADILTGGTKADKIYGGGGADKLFGGNGNDTLTGGKGNDVLTGGNGKDFFVYGSGDGKDVITDYTAGQDKIKLTSGEITKTSYSGSNVIFTVGSGTLTVNDAKGKKITIIDADNKTSTKTYSCATSGRSAMWFADDENFTTNAPALDSVLDIKRVDFAEFSALSDSLSATADFPSLASYSRQQ